MTCNTNKKIEVETWGRTRDLVRVFYGYHDERRIWAVTFGGTTMPIVQAIKGPILDTMYLFLNDI